MFYSDQCKNISLDVIDRIMKLKCSYSSFKAVTGSKNALDFQLSTYLGFVIGQNENRTSKYYIVSNDKGYDCLHKYWKDLGYSVERVPCAAEQDNQEKIIVEVENV